MSAASIPTVNKRREREFSNNHAQRGVIHASDQSQRAHRRQHQRRRIRSVGVADPRRERAGTGPASTPPPVRRDVGRARGEPDVPIWGRARRVRWGRCGDRPAGGPAQVHQRRPLAAQSLSASTPVQPLSANGSS